MTDPVPGGQTTEKITLLNRLIAPLAGVELALRRQGGVQGLSPRLRQTLDLLLAGDSEKQIARKIGLAKSTVSEYVSTLYRRYGVNSHAELMARFLRWRALRNSASTTPSKVIKGPASCL